MVMVDARFESERSVEADHLYLVESPMARPGTYGYGDDSEVARFEPVEDALNRAAEDAGLVSVGRRRGFGKWELAWYGPSGAERALHKVMRKVAGAHLSVSLDPEWSHYHDRLLPRGKDRHRARNGLIVYQLVQAGDSLDIPRLIEFFVYFHREIDRDRYVRDVRSIGLEVAAIDDDGRPGVRAYFIAAVDIELLTDITWELHERATLMNGQFDGWGCSPVIGS